MPVIKVGTIPVPPSKVPTNYIELLELIKDMKEEFNDLEKLKETEKTKRHKIDRQTEITLRKLEILEKQVFKLIEENYQLREKTLEEIIKKFKESNDPEVIQFCLQALISTLNADSLSKEIEAIYAKLENDEEIEI